MPKKDPTQSDTAPYCSNCNYSLIGLTDSSKCPECGKLKLQRLLGTGAGLIFKGSGFYETDYRSDSYNKAAKADSEAKAGKSDKSSDPNASSESKSKSDGKASTKSESSKSNGKAKSNGKSKA